MLGFLKMRITQCDVTRPTECWAIRTSCSMALPLQCEIPLDPFLSCAIRVNHLVHVGRTTWLVGVWGAHLFLLVGLQQQPPPHPASKKTHFCQGLAVMSRLLGFNGRFQWVSVLVILNKCGFTPCDILAFFAPPVPLTFHNVNNNPEPLNP